MKNTIKLSLVASVLVATLSANDDFASATVYSATKSEQSIKDVTSNVNVITAEDIEEKNYTTITQAISSISGIDFTSNGGLGKSSSVRVRGSDSKRVLVLIDGIRYNDITGLNGAPFEHLMISDIEQIEIVKGAQSGIWGADATAGVINIITKSAKAGLHGGVNFEYGSFNTKKYGAFASYKTNKYYFKLSSQKVTNDGFTAKATRNVDIDLYEDDGYENTTSSLKFGIKIDETNKVDLIHTIIDAKSDYDGSNDSLDTTHNTTKDNFSSINFNHIDSFNELDIYIKQSEFDRDSIDSQYSSHYRYDGEVVEYGFKSKIDYGKKDFVIWGIDHKSFEHKNAINNDYKNDALFITNNNSFEGIIGGETICTQSIRKDNYDKFNNKLTGKIGAKHIHKNIEDFTTSINYGTAYNVPTLYNLYNQPTWTQINPETTKSFDITAQYKNLKLTYFNNKTDKMISYKNWTDGYENLDGITIMKGYELEYSRDILEDTLFTFNYTYLDAKDKDGYDLERRAKETLKINLDYYGLANYHLNLNSEYIGDRIEYTYGTHTVDAQTGNYVVWNAVANYDITKSLQTYLKIDNVTDKYYQTVDGYATSPRAYYAGLKYNF